MIGPILKTTMEVRIILQLLSLKAELHIDCKKHDAQALAIIASAAKTNETKVTFENCSHLSETVMLKIAFIGKSYVSFNTPI